MLMPQKSKYKTEMTMRKTKIKKNIETKLKKKNKQDITKYLKRKPTTVIKIKHRQ